MSIYRCHFLDAGEQVAAAEEIDADALPEAIARARMMLTHRAHHRAIEVWQGARRLYATGHAAADAAG
ncbi:MAG TPA: hypothetical protein VME41_09000 [Stellaceae bacterium]|nr:hypothetical protein [Stellaceae bacterium]